MEFTANCCLRAIAFLLFAGQTVVLSAQTANMPGMENSAGFLSSGTSIQPKVTSEFEPMVHTSFGNWIFMFHANAFVVDRQQTGPRGADKFYSANWMMPTLMRQVGRSSVTLRTML